MIYEKLSDFKDIIWEAIKSFIKTKIIEAAITFLLSLLSPIGAFIKVCMAIYDFLMMLVRFKDRIIDLLDSILKAVTDIASGAIDGAANAIEKAFSKSIPVIIGFLAALLHLNDIAAKVRDIITRIRTRVDKAIDWVIGKAYSLIGKVVEGALSIQDKGTAMIEKGKQVVIGAGRKALGWLGLKKEVTLTNREKHSIYFDIEGGSAKLMIATTPMKVETYLAKVKQDNKLNDSDIQKPLATVDKIEKKEKENPAEDLKTRQTNEINALMTQFASELSELPLENSGANSGAIYGGTYQGVFGTSATVAYQQAPFAIGSEPNVDHVEYTKINIRKDGGGSYYVKGHLLNANLGGPGTTWANLAPINRDANKDHQLNFEDKVKDAVNGKASGVSAGKLGYMKGFSVTANYGRSDTPALTHLKDDTSDALPTGADHGWSISELQDLLEGEKAVPTALKCSATIKKNGATAEEKVSHTVANNISYGILNQYQLGVRPKTLVSLASLINTSAKTDKEMTDSFKSITGIGPVRAKNIYEAFKRKGRITNGKADIGVGLLALNNMNEKNGLSITSGNLSWPTSAPIP